MQYTQIVEERDTYPKKINTRKETSRKAIENHCRVLIYGDKEKDTTFFITPFIPVVETGRTYTVGSPLVFDIEIPEEIKTESYLKVWNLKYNDDTQVGDVVLFKQQLKIHIDKIFTKKEVGFRLNDEYILNQKRELEQLRTKYGIR